MLDKSLLYWKYQEVFSFKQCFDSNVNGHNVFCFVSIKKERSNLQGKYVQTIVGNLTDKQLNKAIVACLFVLTLCEVNVYIDITTVLITFRYRHTVQSIHLL